METERTAQEDQHAAVKGGQQENNETREETVNSNVGDCVSPESGPVLRGVDVVAYRSLDSGANVKHTLKNSAASRRGVFIFSFFRKRAPVSHFAARSSDTLAGSSP